MRPSFNIAGPCIPGRHYMLPPERRLGRVLELIDEHLFFTLHAGRQTGKTTSAMWLEEHLNATGQWRAVWVDLETAREKPDVARAMTIILGVCDRALELHCPDLARPGSDEIDAMLRRPDSALLAYITALAAADPRPLVVLLDEADGLVGEAMVSFLTQRWQKFWRKDGHLAADGFGYREAGPHLMLMAFLQRVVNGGGRVEREYGLGRGALDLLIEWKDERHAIEVKLRRDTETELDALDQVTRYLDGLGLAEGCQVMFDLRKEQSWADKLFVREVEHRGKVVQIVGC